MGLPGRGFHNLGECGALGPLNQGKDHSSLAALAGALRLRLRGLLGRFGGLRGRGSFLGCGLGFAALGTFLAFGRALLRAGRFLQGSLLRRNVCALFRNGGGLFGGGVFCVRHGGLVVLSALR